MDIRCDRCETEYEFDEAKLPDAGLPVKCTTCGLVFKVFRPQAPAVPAGIPLRRAGQVIAVAADIATVSQWIGERRLLPTDEFSIAGGPTRTLASAPEFAHLFAPPPVVDTSAAPTLVAAPVAGFRLPQPEPEPEPEPEPVRFRVPMAAASKASDQITNIMPSRSQAAADTELTARVQLKSPLGNRVADALAAAEDETSPSVPSSLSLRLPSGIADAPRAEPSFRMPDLPPAMPAPAATAPVKTEVFRIAEPAKTEQFRVPEEPAKTEQFRIPSAPPTPAAPDPIDSYAVTDPPVPRNVRHVSMAADDADDEIAAFQAANSTGRTKIIIVGVAVAVVAALGIFVVKPLITGAGEDKGEAKAEAPAPDALAAKRVEGEPKPAAEPAKAEPKAAEKPAEKPAEKVAEKESEKPPEKVAEKPAEKPAEKAPKPEKADKPERPEKKGPNVDKLMEQANALLEKGGKPGKVVDLCNQVLAAEPNNMDALYDKGVALVELQRSQDAIDTLQKAIEVNPKFKDAIIVLADTYKEKGQAKEAIQWYKKFLDIEKSGQDADMARRSIQSLSR